MASLTPITELEAVNFLLEAIEEEPVNTLVNTLDPDVTAALNFINQSSRSLQLVGWTFNMEPEMVLSPDVANKISVPDNFIKLTHATDRLARRQGLLYNRDTRSFTFTEAVTLAVIEFLTFEDLPEAARNFVTKDAAYKFQAKRAPDELIAKLTSGDVLEAYEEFVADDTRTLSATFNHHDAIQNRSR